MWATPSLLTKAPCCTMSDLYCPNKSTVSTLDVVKLHMEVGKAKKLICWKCLNWCTPYYIHYNVFGLWETCAVPQSDEMAAWDTLSFYRNKIRGLAGISVFWRCCTVNLSIVSSVFSWYTGFLTNGIARVITTGKHDLKLQKFETCQCTRKNYSSVDDQHEPD